MRTYELVLVIRPVSEADRKKVLDTVKGWLKGAKVTKEDAWGSKALKYAIKKELTGYYYDLMIDADTMPADFEKRLVNTDAVLRHLVIRRK